MSNDLPDIGRVPQKVEPELRRLLEQIRSHLRRLRGLDGSSERAITATDLDGIVSGTAGPAGPPGPPGADGDVYVPDYTAPPTPTGVSVSAGITFVNIETDPPIFTQGHGYAVTVVYGVAWPTSDPTPPTFSEAVKICEFIGDVGSFPTDPSTRWCIWLKWNTQDGIESAFPSGGANGDQITTGQDVSALLEAITGEIRQSELAPALSTRIDLIDGPESLAGSVAARVKDEADAREAADDAHVTRLVDLELSGENLVFNHRLSPTGGHWAAAKIVSRSTSGVPAGAPGDYVIRTYGRDTWMQDRDLTIPFYKIPVRPGEVIDASVWMAQSATTAYDVNMLAACFDASGADLATYPTLVATQSGATLTSWVQRMGTMTVPAGVYFIAIDLQVNKPGTDANAVYFCRPVVNRKAGAAAVTAAALDVVTLQVNDSTSGNSALASRTSVVEARSTALQSAPGNRVSNSSFELDTDGNVVADGFVVYNNAAVAVSTGFVGGFTGGYAQRVDFTGSGTGTQGIVVEGANPAWVPNKTYIAAFMARAFDGQVGRVIQLGWNVGPTSQTALLNPPLSNAWQRYAFRLVMGATVEPAGRLHITSMTGAPSRFGAIDFDDITIYEGTELLPYTSGRDAGGALSAAVLTEQTARVAGDEANASNITTLQSQMAGSSGSNLLSQIQTEASTRVSQTGHLGALYTVRVQLTEGGRTVMGGFGVSGTSGGTAGATIDFGVQANKFWIGAPTGSTGVSDIQPFVVQTTDATVNGVTIPKGVYMDAAYVNNLTVMWARFGTLVADSIQATAISAAQLTLGDGTVGGNLKSTVYTGGSAGWIIRPDGYAEFSNAVIRGAVYASSGTIGGSYLGTNYIMSTNWISGSTGWRFNNDGTGWIGGLWFYGSGLRSASYTEGSSGIMIDGAAGTIKAFSGAGNIVFNTAATGTQSVLKIGSAVDLKANGSIVLAGDITARKLLSADGYKSIDTTATGSSYFLHLRDQYGATKVTITADGEANFYKTIANGTWDQGDGQTGANIVFRITAGTTGLDDWPDIQNAYRLYPLGHNQRLSTKYFTASSGSAGYVWRVGGIAYINTGILVPYDVLASRSYSARAKITRGYRTRSGGSDAGVFKINLCAHVFLENELTGSGVYTDTYIIIGVEMDISSDNQAGNTTGIWVNRISWALDYIP